MEMITAKEIQQDMLDAQIELLEQANAEIESAKQEPKRIEDLKLLGFSLSASQIEFKLQQARELTYLESLHSIEYPSLKFIPDSVMSKVCQKYKLTMYLDSWAKCRLGRLHRSKLTNTISHK